MARRTYTLTLRCPTKGCTERPTFYEYTSQREYAEALKDYPGRTQACTRHRRPDEVLSVENFVRHHVLVASKVPNVSGLYWMVEGAERGGSGFEYGPGFKAYARDFPEGTRLLVTAEIELPADPSQQEGEDR